MKTLLTVLFIFVYSICTSQDTKVPKEQLGNLKVTYTDIGEELASSITSSSLIWDISGSPIRFCNNPSGGTINFTNARVNKSITVIMDLTFPRTIAWPTNAIILDGSETISGVTGKYYIYVHCISSSIYIVSINKKQS